MNAPAIKLTIKLWHDDMPDNPCDMDGWKAGRTTRSNSRTT